MDINLIGDVVKSYTIKERLGKGAFGAVYRAEDQSVNRDVAVKMITPEYASQPEFIRRFEIEAQIVARLEHLHIVPLYDYWRDTSGAYLVMRYMRGGSLYEWMLQGPLPLETVLRLFQQIAGSLAYAHRNRIIHRDLKPQNILLDEDKNAYLSDFGIAKVLVGTTSQDAEDSISGSWEYISPEQIKSEKLTPRSDIYSLGLLLYELLTAERPYPASSPAELVYAHLETPVPDVTEKCQDLPAGVNEVIQKATAKSPDARFGDAVKLVNALVNSLKTPTLTVVQEQKGLIEKLSDRELEVLLLKAQGLQNQEIANKLFITKATIRYHLRQIYGKLNIEGTNKPRKLYQRALELGILDQKGGESALAWDVIASQDVGENPYKGLRAFAEDEGDDFFGRDDFIEQMIDRMQETGPGSRFLAVVGPSGSGKSSVVRAGLIPALHEEAIPGSKDWFMAVMTPGPYPLEALEIALIKISPQQYNLSEHLDRDQRGLIRAANIILPQTTQLLLVIDQFEEVFTQVQDEARRSHFLDLLTTAVTEPDSRVRVVITLRADFYDRPLMIPQLGELVRTRMETVLPLTPDELKAAILEPAMQANITIQSDLVGTMISEFNEQPGALPLLQYTLTELFEQRRERSLTLDVYRDLGGVKGALAGQADLILENYAETEQETIRQLFLRLVTLGEGTEDIRRRVLLSELQSLDVENDLLDDIISEFGAKRLLTFDHDPVTRGPTVEVAHEALIREWGQLRTWLEDSRDDIRLQRILANAAQDWQKAEQEESYLLTGARLTQFEAWAQSTDVALTEDERRFLEASVQERQRREAEEQARREHEAALERRARRVFQVLTIVLLFAALGGVGLSVFAFDREAKALREAKVNRSLVLANEAINISVVDGTFSGFVLALAAVNMEDPPIESVNILRNLASRNGIKSVIPIGIGKTWSVAVSPDAHTVVIGGCSNGEFECSASNGLLTFLNLDTEQVTAEYSLNAGRIDVLTWHPAGSQIAFSTIDGMTGLFDTSAGKVSLNFTGYDLPVHDLIFNATGDILYAAGDDGALILWDTSSGEIVEQIDAHMAAINDLDINSDESHMLSASIDGRVIMWDLDNLTPQLTYTYEGDSGVLGAVFLPSRSEVFVSTGDWSYMLWDTSLNSIVKQTTDTVPNLDIAALRDGKSVAALKSRTIEILDLDTWTPISRHALDSAILHLDVHAEAGLMAWTEQDGALVLAALAENNEVRTYNGFSIDVSPSTLDKTWGK